MVKLFWTVVMDEAKDALLFVAVVFNESIRVAAELLLFTTVLVSEVTDEFRELDVLVKLELSVVYVVENDELTVVKLPCTVVMEEARDWLLALTVVFNVVTLPASDEDSVVVELLSVVMDDANDALLDDSLVCKVSIREAADELLLTTVLLTETMFAASEALLLLTVELSAVRLLAKEEE